MGQSGLHCTKQVEVDWNELKWYANVAQYKCKNNKYSTSTFKYCIDFFLTQIKKQVTMTFNVCLNWLFIDLLNS